MSDIDRIEFEAAFLLHANPYRESSQVIEVFSQDHGRVGLVARGSRRPKSRWKSVLRPFQPMRMSWSGRGTLQTLRAAEPTSLPLAFTGMCLMAGYYLNELLIALLHRCDPHPDLFAHYGSALAMLAAGEELEPTLRRFELALLSEIGYGLVTDRDAVEGQPVCAESWYEYFADQGPVPIAPGSVADGRLVVTGADLTAIGNGVFDRPESLPLAKRLLREKLNWHLGGRALKTRQVIASMHDGLTAESVGHD
ncbi:MAG: DNA repair protein RecO [Gammaproteobacteria bacterium]|jgi:DNA repair protein RecO (recombination protein O)|nr:DNA repair protein RecO [Chromatiales bacterium]MDP6673366.1 DNA repair protein RecO [Gammaproteobacteria bacterium]